MVTRYPFTRLLAAALCLGASTMAAQGQHDLGTGVEAAMSPKLAWIAKDKMRAGYNYNAPLEFYPIAKACGMNAIFARLEIANDPRGDVGLLDTLKPGARKSDALQSYELIEPSSRLAKKLGLHWFYMLDMAGSRGNYNDGVRDNPRRYNNGELFAPTDDIYWTRVVENRFMRVAEMVRGPEFQIDGFLIDPEMYALHGSTPPGLDVGDYALGEFLEHAGLTMDFKGLSMEERHERLGKQNLLERLEAFQFERVKALAQRTRERVQAIHPDAVFGFFLWRKSFWFRAVAAGLSTARTPCLVGPESTYSGVFDEHFLAYQDHVRREAKVPILFVPGLALGSEDAPDMLAAFEGNLYHRGITTQGYWFWALSRAFGNAEKRGTVSKMLATVNSELDKYSQSGGKHDSPLKPKALPAGVPTHLQDTLLAARSWVPVPETALPDKAPPPAGMQLRGLHTFVFRARKGDKVAFQVMNVRLGQYFSPTSVKAFRPDGSEVDVGMVPLNESRELTVEVDQTGNWLVAVTSGKTVGNAFRVSSAAPQTVLYAPRGPVAGCRGEEAVFRYFFYVPKATQSFELEMAASKGEVATFRLFGPDGALLQEEVALTRKVTRTIDAKALAGRVCWLETTDVIEDHSFELIGIPTIFACEPGQLLVPEL